MEDFRQLIAAILSLLLLFAYAVIFGWVYFYYPEESEIMRAFDAEIAAEPVAYIWTSVSVLVGGVVAVAFGVPEPKPLFPVSPATIIVIYAVVYFLVGIWAVFAWLSIGQKANLLIINAATTFIGLAVPIVSAFLRQGQQRAGGRPGAGMIG